MNEKDIKAQAMIHSLANQRNIALNGIVQAEVEIAVLKERIKLLEIAKGIVNDEQS